MKELTPSTHTTDIDAKAAHSVRPVRHNRRERTAFTITASAAALALTACGHNPIVSGAAPENTSSVLSTTSPVSTTANFSGGPYCDLGNRAPAYGKDQNGRPTVEIDSRCTDPSDPYTGVYDVKGTPHQEAASGGIPFGHIPNGAIVTEICRLPEGGWVQNGIGVGTNDWDKVVLSAGQRYLTHSGSPATTQAATMVLVPNVHLGFYDDSGQPKC